MSMTRQWLKVHRTEHEYVGQRLSSYLDDQLSEEERARVEDHLHACERCRRDLRTLRWTTGLLRETPALEVPRSFVLREADLAPQRAAPAWRSPFALRWATAVVAVLLVLVVAGDALTGAWLPRHGAAPPVAYQGAPRAEWVEKRAAATAVATAAATVVEEKEMVPQQEAPAQPQEEGAGEPAALAASPEERVAAESSKGMVETPAAGKAGVTGDETLVPGSEPGVPGSEPGAPGSEPGATESGPVAPKSEPGAPENEPGAPSEGQIGMAGGGEPPTPRALSEPVGDVSAENADAEEEGPLRARVQVEPPGEAIAEDMPPTAEAARMAVQEPTAQPLPTEIPGPPPGEGWAAPPARIALRAAEIVLGLLLLGLLAAWMRARQRRKTRH
jgi:hypothetical protein